MLGCRPATTARDGSGAASRSADSLGLSFRWATGVSKMIGSSNLNGLGDAVASSCANQRSGSCIICRSGNSSAFGRGGEASLQDLRWRAGSLGFGGVRHFCGTLRAACFEGVRLVSVVCTSRTGEPSASGSLVFGGRSCRLLGGAAGFVAVRHFSSVCTSRTGDSSAPGSLAFGGVGCFCRFPGGAAGFSGVRPSFTRLG